MEKNFHHDLAPGTWLYIKPLPDGATEENLAAYFKQCGLEITPAHIGINRNGSYNGQHYAVVSIPEGELAVMVNWVLNQQPFLGVPIEVHARARRQTPRNPGRA